MSEEINFGGSIDIKGGQNVLGKNEGGMHQGRSEDAVNLSKFVNSVAEAVPESDRIELVPMMQRFTQMENDDQQAAMDNDDPAWTGIVDHVRRNATPIWKNIATFSAAALKSFAERQPLVAGVMAVCEANKA